MSSQAPDDSGRGAQTDAWGALSLVLSGVLVWGGVGWLLSSWLNHPVFVAVGLVLGMGAALYLVWLRYGRPEPGSTPEPPAGGRTQ